MSDYMNSGVNCEVMKDGNTINAAAECRALQRQLVEKDKRIEELGKYNKIANELALQSLERAEAAEAQLEKIAKKTEPFWEYNSGDAARTIIKNVQTILKSKQ